MAEGKIETAGVAGLLGAGLAVAGSFLPWVKVEGFVSLSKAGTEGDGTITLVLGIVGLLLALAMVRKPIPSATGVIVALLGLATAGVAAYDLQDGADKLAAANSTSTLIHASWGVGIYMVVAGGAVMVLGGLLGYSERAKNGEVAARKPVEEARVPCPHCAELILPSAHVCPHCNRDITRVELAPMPPGTGQGWYTDPSVRYPLRWWNGNAWSQWVSADGITSEDPPLPRLA